MNYQVDFYAKRIHFLEHMLPIFHALGAKAGDVFVSPELARECAGRDFGVDLVEAGTARDGTPDLPPTGRAIVTAAYGDLTDVINAERHKGKRIKIFMEHGAGFTFSNAHPSYAGGGGLRNKVSLFLATNDYVANKNYTVNPVIPNEIIGCPKLDKWHQNIKAWTRPEQPVIAISFHWDCKVSFETRSALPWFRAALPELAERYKVLGHAHPRERAEMKRMFERFGIEFVEDFDDILTRADVYINDASSTLYEFASLDKPVVVLNAPIYRRHIAHGLRFWEHADVGVQCDDARKLLEAVEKALQDSPTQKAKRAQAVAAAYPVRGNAAETAAKAICAYLDKKPLPQLGDYAEPGEPLTHIEGKSIGVIYMAFGAKAARGVEKSAASLRRLGFNIPVTVVGDSPARGCEFIKWQGQSPFDPNERKNFQFRSGRVKPFLYDYSPYDWTLYIDADTEFLRDITPGFLMLKDFDIAIAEEKNPISKLYNKALAGWEVNIQERDYTLQELGADEKFLNSGVIFFRKSPACARLWQRWQAEWLKFRQWDEQLALVRALHKTKGLSVKRLSIDWNHPHKFESRTAVIFHNYGRGDVRTSA